MSAETLLRSLHDQRLAAANARRLYARQLAPGFNVFDFIAPSEVKLSSILAWLLDPSGSHGQGTLFLSEFLIELGFGWAADGLEGTDVSVEAPTFEGRRIDVVVRMPGAILGIENKPFAADQIRQAYDYLAWLDRQRPDGRTCLVYLAGSSGMLPAETSIATEDRLKREQANQFKATSYSHLLPWLARIRGRCEALEVSSFLKFFMQYIEKRFMGISDMTEQDALVETALSSDENLRSALDIVRAGAAIRSSVLSVLSRQVTTELPEGFGLNYFEFASGKYGGMSISLPNVSGMTFCVQFEAGNVQSGDLHWLIYGMSNGGATKNLALKAKLDAFFGLGQTTQTWLRYRRAYATERFFPVEDDWRLVSPWLDALNGVLARKVIDAAVEFNAVLAA